MLSYIWTHWAQVWDFLALEWVEDWGSLLLGYMLAASVFVPLMIAPVSLFLAHKKRAWVWALMVVIWLSASVWILATFQIHDIWNSYQHWYTTPSDPSWTPVVPGYRFGPSG